MHSGYGTKLNYGKDVLYDFLKNEWVDWGKILTNFSRQFLKITKSKGDSTDISSPKCLIIDDTLLCKTGKTIEHILGGKLHYEKFVTVFTLPIITKITFLFKSLAKILPKSIFAQNILLNLIEL